MKYLKFRDASGIERNGRRTPDGVRFGGEMYPQETIETLPPTTPSKVIGMSKNNVDYAEMVGFDLPETPRPFFESPTSIIGHNDPIQITDDHENQFEAEFGVVIDEQCRNVPEEKAEEVMRGFTCVNDVTNQTNMGDFYVSGKSFDTSTPIGPVIATPDEITRDAGIELTLNGERMQQSSLDRYQFSASEIIEYLSSFMTLERGDLIQLGTSPGKSRLSDGDVVAVSIDGVGTLSNPVVSK